jgi:hypothetical protein
VIDALLNILRSQIMYVLDMGLHAGDYYFADRGFRGEVGDCIDGVREGF